MRKRQYRDNDKRNISVVICDRVTDSDYPFGIYKLFFYLSHDGDCKTFEVMFSI